MNQPAATASARPTVVFLPVRKLVFKPGQTLVLQTLVLLTLFAVSCFSCTNGALAQTKVNVDEEVKVLFLGDWRDGVVVETKGKIALVEFEFANNMKQQAFQRKDIRRLNEVDAMDFCRTWKSASGSFSVDAALGSINGDEITLIKEDLTEIKLSLDKLSTKDQSYVKKMGRENEKAIKRGLMPAPVPTLPEIDSFDGGFGEQSTIVVVSSSDKLVTLGSLPKYMRDFQQSGLGFDFVREDQEVVAIIPVGGPEQLVLVTTREKYFPRRGPAFQSQLYWVSLKSKKVIETAALPAEDFPIDYDPKQGLLLAFNEKYFADDEDDPDHFSLWKLEPTGDSPKPICRWESGEVKIRNELFGKIINERTVFAKVERQTYVAWDIIDKKELYRVKLDSFFDAPITVSADRKHLILPEDGRVAVLDASNGDAVFSVPVDDRHVSAACVNDAGTKLAGLTERSIYVWDLASGAREPTVYSAPLIGNPFRSRLEWLDDDHLFGQTANSRVLFRLSLGLPIWSYEMDGWNANLNRDQLTNMVVDGKFFYTAKPGAFSKGIAIGAVNLPGPQVEEVTGSIDPESLMVLKAGSAVRFEFVNVSDEARVKKSLTKSAQAADWVVTDDAEFVIEAEMGVGKTQSVTYETIGRRGDNTTVSFQPHFANVKIKRGPTVVWQTGTSTGAPPFIRGRNVESKVKSYQSPQIGFFDRVKFESPVLDPKYSRGFGVSKLGLRGIEVVSTSPPGRQGDPAEEEQASEGENDGQSGAGRQ